MAPPTPPPPPPSIGFRLPPLRSTTCSKECLWSEREADEDVEYRTISEVVNPLYIGAATQVTKNRQDGGGAEKKEKNERGTGISFWSQVLSLLSSTMAFLTIVTFICMILFLRTESA